MRRLLGVWLAAALAGAAQSAPDPSRAIFGQIGAALEELGRISGLRARRPVIYDLISRDKVKEFLEKRVQEVATPEELRIEELTLKKFGLVPADFDLAQATVDLLTEQAAAFYDFRKKKLYITDWTESEAREAALVHELAHALADQNFNLDRFIKQARHSDDEAMARMAVMEGQASWLMSEYLVRRNGQSLAASTALLEMMSRATESGAGQFPVFDQAPLYLRRTLIFPYTKGMLFQHAVFEKLGTAAFAEVFRRPPASTEHILHPERYFAGRAPARPPLPELPSKRGYRKLADGSVGELDHGILLEQYAGREVAERVAPLWRGGRYALLENRSQKRAVLAYASEWASEEAAREFFNLYRGVLEKKWKRMTVDERSGGTLSGAGDDGRFFLKVEGVRFSSLEGLAGH